MERLSAEQLSSEQLSTEQMSSEQLSEEYLTSEQISRSKCHGAIVTFCGVNVGPDVGGAIAGGACVMDLMYVFTIFKKKYLSSAANSMHTTAPDVSTTSNVEKTSKPDEPTTTNVERTTGPIIESTGSKAMEAVSTTGMSSMIIVCKVVEYPT